MAGLKGRAKARSRASGRDEAEKREEFLFHIIAPWRATVGEFLKLPRRPETSRIGGCRGSFA